MPLGEENIQKMLAKKEWNHSCDEESGEELVGGQAYGKKKEVPKANSYSDSYTRLVTKEKQKHYIDWLDRKIMPERMSSRELVRRKYGQL